MKDINERVSELESDREALRFVIGVLILLAIGFTVGLIFSHFTTCESILKLSNDTNARVIANTFVSVC